MSSLEFLLHSEQKNNRILIGICRVALRELMRVGENGQIALWNQDKKSIHVVDEISEKCAGRMFTKRLEKHAQAFTNNNTVSASILITHEHLVTYLGVILQLRFNADMKELE